MENHHPMLGNMSGSVNIQGWHYWLANHDFKNMFIIPPNVELNTDLGGHQFLYGERYFPNLVLQDISKSKDRTSPYNSERYDGYMYLQDMAWKVPAPEQIGFGRGILQEIPKKGYAGWVCHFNGECPDVINDFDTGEETCVDKAWERYACKHVFIPNGKILLKEEAPDLRWNDYEILDGRGFRC